MVRGARGTSVARRELGEDGVEGDGGGGDSRGTAGEQQGAGGVRA